MYTQTNIVEKLNFFDIECDITEVAKLILELHIEPIYEDENNELYYDEDAYEALKSKLQIKKSELEAKNAEIVEEAPKEEKETTALVSDTSAKSIQVIAKTIAQQITEDLGKYIKNTEKIEEAFKAGAYKRDNEILSKKLQNTISDNKKLIEKIRMLEFEHSKYHQVFGNIYVKGR